MKEITRQTLLINLLQTIGIILFISLSTTIFGKQEGLTAVATVTALLMFLYLPMPCQSFQGTLATSLGFLFFGTIASLNLMVSPLLMLPINLLGITLLMLLFGQQFLYKFFMPYILVYIFAATTDIPDFSFPRRLAYLLVSSVLIAFIYYFRYRQHTDKTPFFQKKNLTWALLQPALLMSVGISLALYLSQVFHLEKGMWICMTVMSLTQLHPSETTRRFKGRLIGTLLGTFTYLLFFSYLIPESYHLLFVMVSAFIYAFIENYVIQLIFITMNVLYASKELFSLDVALYQRFSFIILGSIIVFSLLAIMNLIKKSPLIKQP